MSFQTDYSTALIFYAVDSDFRDIGIAVVEFASCLITKFGYPNEEAIHGHPLYSQGLEQCSFYEVLNPTWLAEINDQNRVSFQKWEGYSARHFIVTFHDSTFECLARCMEIAVVNRPMDDVVPEVARHTYRADDEGILSNLGRAGFVFEWSGRA